MILKTNSLHCSMNSVESLYEQCFPKQNQWNSLCLPNQKASLIFLRCRHTVNNLFSQGKNNPRVHAGQNYWSISYISIYRQRGRGRIQGRGKPDHVHQFGLQSFSVAGRKHLYLVVILWALSVCYQVVDRGERLQIKER